jgi:hypothetical protein
MGTKLCKAAVSVLLAGTAALLVAPPAEANRGGGTTTTTTEPGYVPAYGQNPNPVVAVPDPYANPEVAPTVVPVDLPAVTDPGAGLAGDGDRLNPAPSDAPAAVPQVLDRTESRPVEDGFMGGILSRTGAETLPLARAGLGALALGLGLVILARRRRVEA